MKSRIFACAALLALPAFGAAAGFRAAVVKLDITPSEPKWMVGYAARQSTGVHDRLFHKILVLDDGRGEFVLVSTDLCVMAPSVYDETAAKLKSALGIEPERFWWTLTHTHSGPEIGPPGLPKLMMPERYTHDWDREYTAQVEGQLVEGVKRARAQLAPARLKIGTGTSSANINRRARDPQGRISLGMNPDGPTDRQIGILLIENAAGAPLALVANYAMHGTALGSANTLISGDAPGIVAAYLEEKLGAPALFVNGATGDIAPIYSVQKDFGAAHITEFNVLLGDRVLAALKNVTAIPEVRLRPGKAEVETPRRPGFGWDESLGDYLRPGGENGMIRMPVRFLELDRSTMLWAAPVELFSEIAMRIRQRAPFRSTFYFGYANGWLGYLTTKQAFAEGGYEPKTSPFTDRVEEDLSKAVTAYIAAAGARK
jgi:neutral ceramidase